VDACRQGNGSRVTAYSERSLRSPPLRDEQRRVCVASLCLCLCLSPTFIPDLARLAHAPSANDTSGLGGHRAHAPVLTPRERLSLPLPLPLSRSLFLNRAARLIPPLSLSLSLSLFLCSCRVFIRVYTHTFPLPHNNVLPYSLTFGLLRFCRLDRASVPQIIASFFRTNIGHNARRIARASQQRVIIDVNYRGSPTSADFGTLLSTFLCPPLPPDFSPFCRFRGPAVSRLLSSISPSTESSLEYTTV